jgi:tetratricopeptide (TPR) repeat protein
MSLFHRPAVMLLAAGCAALLAGCARDSRYTSASPEAIRLYQRGVTHWDNFYLGEALASLDSALQIDSSFALAWGRRGLVLNAMSRTADGQVSLDHALLHAAGATTREKLTIAVWDRMLRFDYAGAVAAADSLLHFYPEEKEAYLFRGELYEVADKDYDAAVRYYLKAVEVDSTYARAVMSLGYAYSAMGLQKKGIPMMERYIRLNPTAADPHASLADLLVRAGKFDEAIDQYNQSLKIKPDYWYSFVQLGNVKLTLGRLKEAEQDYRRWIAIAGPGSGMRSLQFAIEGHLALARRRYGEAEESFRAGIGQDSTNMSAVIGLVEALANLKNFPGADRAINDLEREIRRRNLLHSTAMVNLHVMRARVLAAEGKYQDALSSCDSALAYSVVQTRAGIDRQIAEIQFVRGEYDLALDACSDALDISPNAPKVLLLLTRIYQKTGDAGMTGEIGHHLLDIWRDADPDFADKNDLLRLLGMSHGI